MNTEYGVTRSLATSLKSGETTDLVLSAHVGQPYRMHIRFMRLHLSLALYQCFLTFFFDHALMLNDFYITLNESNTFMDKRPFYFNFNNGVIFD